MKVEELGLKQKILDYGFLFGLAGILIALDQISKGLVRTRLPVGNDWSPWPWLAPYASIVHWKNDGAAFGMFQGFNDVFKVLAILVAAAIVYYYPRVARKDWYLRLAMGMQLGGAIGNLIDRLLQGEVTDFIVLLPRWHFPVFNLADLSLTSGVIVMLVGVWITERKQSPALPATVPPMDAAQSNEAQPVTANQPQDTLSPTSVEESQGG
jgi:signal peptidase II